MKKMYTEIITVVVLLFLLYCRPTALVNFTNTIIGKVLFVGATIIASLINPLAGLFFATIMIIFMEQNYEGFKEGQSGAIELTTLFNFKAPPADADANVGTLITCKVDTDDDNGNPLNAAAIGDIKKKEVVQYKNNAINDDIISKYNIIDGITDTTTIDFTPDTDVQIEPDADATNGVGIIILPSPASAPAVPDIDVDTDDTGKIKVDNTDSTLVKDNYVNIGGNLHKITNVDEPATGETKSTITIEPPISQNQSATQIKEIYPKTIMTTPISIDTKSYPTESSKLTLIPSDTTTIADGDKFIILAFSKISDNKIYTINANGVTPSVNIKLTQPINTDLGPGVNLTIIDHDHIHSHESFVGGRKEGFFAGDVKKEVAVKGAYAEETYEDEIIGETICSSNLCDRIDSEFKLIRPINSNDHTPSKV